VPAPEFFEIEAGAGERARHQILNEHVGTGDQAREQLVVDRVLDVENDGFLAAVEPYEIAALAPCGAVVAACEIAFRPLDFDDPCAGVGKPTGAQRCGDRLLDRHNQDTFERLRHLSAPV
jgi:hypothetical protein